MSDDSSTDEFPEVPAAVWVTRLHQKLSDQHWLDFKNALNETPKAFLRTIGGAGAEEVLNLLSRSGHQDIATQAAKTLDIHLS